MQPARFAFLDHPGPIAMAHRGGGAENPENTWEAFRHAVDLGYRYVETDVHATADGVVVAFHDPEISRTTNSRGLVRETLWSDLARVQVKGSAHPVPRLDEVLAEWPELRWNIDAKHDSVVGPLLETIHRSKAADRVCVTSFSDRRLSRLAQALGPAVCIAMGPAMIASLRLASVTPGPALTMIGRSLAERLARAGAAQVPLRQGRVPIVDDRFVETAHRFGIQVHVWTINDEDAMTALFDLGVDGIMTDRPTALRDVLVQRGAWR